MVLEVDKSQHSQVYCVHGTFSPSQLASSKSRYFLCVPSATGWEEPLESLGRWDRGSLFQVDSSASRHNPRLSQTLFGSCLEIAPRLFSESQWLSVHSLLS